MVQQASEIDTAADPALAPFELTPAQVKYFDTFGFLHIPELFADDIDTISAGFEEVFENEGHPRLETYEELHLGQRRTIIPAFVTKSDKLSWLLDDHRVTGTVSSLMGDSYEYAESDGNIFDCESSWHPDMYSAPMWQYHLKLSFYLEPLHGETGAIRMIPGSNHHTTTYAKQLRKNLEHPREIEAIYGVDYKDVPSWTLESDPGDLVLWNFRTIHASFNGGERRRLFSINFRDAAAEPPPKLAAKQAARRAAENSERD